MPLRTLIPFPDHILPRLGTVADSVIAEELGVARSLVTKWRLERGIPAMRPKGRHTPGGAKTYAVRLNDEEQAALAELSARMRMPGPDVLRYLLRSGRQVG